MLRLCSSRKAKLSARIVSAASFNVIAIGYPNASNVARVSFGSLHEAANARLNQCQRRQREPRELATSARVSRPVKIDAWRALWYVGRVAYGLDEPGYFVGGFLLHAQQHHGCAKLFWQHLVAQYHAHRNLRFLKGQLLRQSVPRPRIRTYCVNGCVSVIRNSLDDGWILQKSPLHGYGLDYDDSDTNPIIKKATNE